MPDTPNIPTDAVLEKARNEAIEAVKAAFAETGLHLSDAAATRMVYALRVHFHLSDRGQDWLGEQSKAPHDPMEEVIAGIKPI